MEVWQNVTPETGHWIGVDLRQVGSNTRAVGAWIEIRTELGSQVREVTVGGGHAGGHALPQHFGLGQASGIRLRVIWPDGATGDWQTFPTNQVVTITRP